MRFEWDERKNASNRRQHGLSFAEARSVFFDDDAVLFADPDDGADEERFILLGASWSLRLLVVVHCLREAGEVIRIISARRATKRERVAYPGGG